MKISCVFSSILFLIISSVVIPVYGQQTPSIGTNVTSEENNEAENEDSIKVGISGSTLESLSETYRSIANDVPVKYIEKQPYLSLQQLIKGNLAGTYIQEPSGEPGTEQNIFIRGISSPLLSKKELFDNQATVYLNGIPLTQDNPFVYEIQKYDFNRIGTATNILSFVNPDNIESIEVIKDPYMLAKLGPIAANGAIWITTKNASSGYREISVNLYGGATLKPRITPINADFENKFRKPFYDKYGTTDDRLNYPTFLRDSTNADYYGPANWSDLYYQNSPLLSADLSLTGGSERANFRFFTGATKNAAAVHDNSLDRFTGAFFINVMPLSWLTVSSMISYDRLDRHRNKNIRDRLAEQRYIPDLTNPLTPNKLLYGEYLDQFDAAIDKNITNLLRGYVALKADLGKLHYNGQIGFDYNEGTRDVFWPTTLLEGNNFLSNYFGYNQRFIVSNSLGYNFDLGNSSLAIEGGQTFLSDLNKYDYSYGYNGPNDFIKINVVDGDPNKDDYLKPVDGLRAYYFPSRMQQKLISFYGTARYELDDFLTVSGLVRRDGSSNMQPDHHWFTSYSAGVGLDLYRKLNITSSSLNALSLTGSYGRIGKLISDDRFNGGPSYRVDMGFSGEPTLGSYAGIPGISRPYSTGWVGYGIPWAYTDQMNVGVRLGLFDERAQIALDVYNNNDKDMLLPMPVPVEWGYESAYESGLEVNNKGIEAAFQVGIIRDKINALNWTFTGNIAYNKNKLKALPGGAKEVILGDQKLEVGKPIDAFWLLTNKGIYNSDAEIPTSPDGEKMTYRGLTLQAGDPQWADLNHDYVIDNEDMTLQGNFLPQVTGGFGSQINYKQFSFDFQFYFALKRQILNQYASQKLNFINVETSNDINSVKEITFWEKKMDMTSYPIYNPWSDVVPYREDQNLFLDNGAFMKLRSVSLGYDLAPLFKKQTTIRRALLYVTGTNLWTITKFKGDDPELTQYNGIYNGYGIRIPASVIMGLKLDL